MRILVKPSVERMSKKKVKAIETNISKSLAFPIYAYSNGKDNPKSMEDLKKILDWAFEQGSEAALVIYKRRAAEDNGVLPDSFEVGFTFDG